MGSCWARGRIRRGWAAVCTRCRPWEEGLGGLWGQAEMGSGPGQSALGAAQTSGLLSGPGRATNSWSRNGQSQAVREGDHAHPSPLCGLGMMSRDALRWILRGQGLSHSAQRARGPPLDQGLLSKTWRTPGVPELPPPPPFPSFPHSLLHSAIHSPNY